MASFLEDFRLIKHANREMWEGARSGAPKPFLPFGKAQRRYEEAQRLAAVCERYGIPYFEGPYREWALEAVLAFDRANPYPQTPCTLPENAAAKVLENFAELKTDTDWTHRLFQKLENSWGLDTSWNEAGELYGAFVDGAPPALDRRETACYFALEAEVFERIAPPPFNVRRVTSLHANLRRRLAGEEPQGPAIVAGSALPPLPNLTAAFDRALPSERILACERAFWKAFGTFSRNMRFAYGRQKGWVRPYHGRGPADGHALRTDWGRRLILLYGELNMLTHACYDDVWSLVQVATDFSAMLDAPTTRRLFFKPQRAKLCRFTPEERGRRDRAEKKRHADAIARIKRDEERAAQRRGGMGGAPDEFDEAFGSCEFGNSYSYAWYTDRDTYNDPAR